MAEKEYREHSEHSSEKGHHTESGSAGIGLGVDVNVRLGGLRDTLGMLTESLKETGEKATSLVTDAVRKLREAGVGELKKQAQGGGEERDLYNRIVEKLQSASQKGEGQARELLRDLGENVEEGGKSMQEEGTRH